MRAKSASTNLPEELGEPLSRSFLVAGHRVGAAKAAPGLHLVATPIGNLGDITLRAVETLAGVDAIACEDTRITRRLTERYGIAAPLTPYHEHNAAVARPKLLQRLAQGASVALVSDAGTPLISDPGFKLVREASGAGFSASALQRDSLKDAVAHAVELSGRPRREIYARALELARQGAKDGDGEDR